MCPIYEKEDFASFGSGKKYYFRNGGVLLRKFSAENSGCSEDVERLLT